LGAFALAVVWISTLPGIAASAKGNKRPAQLDASSIGYVDLSQVTEKLKETATWKAMEQQANTERTRLDGQLKQLSRSRYLSDAERRTLQALEAKPKVSAAEKRKIEALRQKSVAIDKEYNRLSQVEKPTKAQNDRLKQLTDIRTAAIENLQNQRAELQAQLEKKQLDLLEKMRQHVTDIINQVAKSNGMTVVIDRSAIIVGGTDLTTEVLQKLPK